MFDKKYYSIQLFNKFKIANTMIGSFKSRLHLLFLSGFFAIPSIVSAQTPYRLASPNGKLVASPQKQSALVCWCDDQLGREGILRLIFHSYLLKLSRLNFFRMVSMPIKTQLIINKKLSPYPTQQKRNFIWRKAGVSP